MRAYWLIPKTAKTAFGNMREMTSWGSARVSVYWGKRYFIFLMNEMFISRELKKVFMLTVILKEKKRNLF